VGFEPTRNVTTPNGFQERMWFTVRTFPTWAFSVSALCVIQDHPAYIPRPASALLHPGACSVTACTVQGMARVRSGQAHAWPLVSDRRGCRGSAAQGWVLKIVSAKRLEMIFGCPWRWRGTPGCWAGHPRIRASQDSRTFHPTRPWLFVARGHLILVAHLLRVHYRIKAGRRPRAGTPAVGRCGPLPGRRPCGNHRTGGNTRHENPAVEWAASRHRGGCVTRHRHRIGQRHRALGHDNGPNSPLHDHWRLHGSRRRNQGQDQRAGGRGCRPRDLPARRHARLAFTSWRHVRHGEERHRDPR